MHTSFGSIIFDLGHCFKFFFSAGKKFVIFLQKKNFPVLKLTQVLLQSNKYPYNISKAVRAGNAAVLKGFA